MSMGEISSKVLEDILLGKREATAFDFYKIDDGVFFNEGDRFYIGSDECYWPDFCRELLSYYGTEENSDVIIESEGVIYHEGFFEGSSFRTLLRELRKRPVSSIEDLVGFYVEFLILENGMEEYSDSVLSKDSCAAGSEDVYQQPSQGEIEDYLEKERKRAADYLEKLSKEVGAE